MCIRDRHRPLVTKHLQRSGDRTTIEFTSFHRVWLWSQVDVVGFDFRVQRRGIHSEQARGARLVAAGLFQSSPDQIDLKPPYFFVEIYSAPDVTYRGVAGAILM